MPSGVYKKTKEHKIKIGEANKKPILNLKYPKLSVELNRARKLTDEQIIRIINLYARGKDRHRLADKFKVSYHTIYLYTNPSAAEKQRIAYRTRYHEKYKFDKEYRKKNTQRSIESKKYRMKMNEKQMKNWRNDICRKRYRVISLKKSN